MTIVHITNSRKLSGGARQAVLLAGGQRAAGHRVVFCAPPGSALLGEVAAAGVETRNCDFGGLWGQWRASRRLRRLVREVGADVVHTHHTKGHNVGLLATFGGPFPPLVVKRGVLFRPELPWKFRTRRVAAVVTNSDAVRDVLARCGVPPGKVHVVANARQLPAVNPEPAAQATLRQELGLDKVRGALVGTVGSGRPEKGFQVLVEAAPAILEAYPDACIVLVGAGAEHLQARVQELEVADRVRFTGFRPDAVEVMRLLDLFVFPSVDMDTCSNVLLEAMSLGLPVVGSDLRGMEEVLGEADGSGRLFRSGDARDLARCVLEVLADPTAAAVMGARARQRIARGHDLESRVEAILALYRSLSG